MSLDMAWPKKIIDKLVDCWTRPKGPGWLLVKCCTPLLISRPAYSFVLAWAQRNQSVVLGVLENPVAEWLSNLVTIISALGVLVGIFMMLSDYISMRRAASRDRIVAVEFRGLVETTSTPLMNAVTGSPHSQRSLVLVDVKDHIIRGGKEELQQAIQAIHNIRQRLIDHCHGTDRENIHVIAGGVMPVALQFYAGHVLDNLSSITLMDWNRIRDCWQSLDEIDDNGRFLVTGTMPALGNEVVLAMSISYPVDKDAIAACFPGLPVIHLSLIEPVTNSLWSNDKQEALCKQFLQKMDSFTDLKAVHLILAAPSSFCLRIGRHYDFKNHPPLTIYDYHRGKLPAYQWGLKLSNNSQQLPSIIMNTGNELEIA